MLLPMLSGHSLAPWTIGLALQKTKEMAIFIVWVYSTRKNEKKKGKKEDNLTGNESPERDVGAFGGIQK